MAEYTAGLPDAAFVACASPPQGSPLQGKGPGAVEVALDASAYVAARSQLDTRPWMLVLVRPLGSRP